MREWKDIIHIRNISKILAVILCVGLLAGPVADAVAKTLEKPGTELTESELTAGAEQGPDPNTGTVSGTEESVETGTERNAGTEAAPEETTETEAEAEEVTETGTEAAPEEVTEMGTETEAIETGTEEMTETAALEEVTPGKAPVRAPAMNNALAAGTYAAGSNLGKNQLTNNGTYQLTADMTMSSTIQISQNENYTIDLNGHTLMMSGGNAYFQMLGGTLTILDSSQAQTGTVMLSTNLVQYANGGTFNLESGTVDGAAQTTKPQHGGAVDMYTSNNGNGYFNMSGGTIRNCTSTQYGGAVYIGGAFSGKTSNFYISGGTIENCSSEKGGAIYVDGQGAEAANGNLTISGGTISGNTASQGAAIFNNGNFYLQGYVDINGTVYFRNAWEGYQNWIHITGPLCVLGNGYIDVDTTYWDSGYANSFNNSYAPEKFGSGYTVVENSSNGAVDAETFYPYKEYFYNTTRGMGVTAGYEKIDQAWTNTNHWMKYTDVMGIQWNVTEARTGSPGEYQTKDFLIYAGIGKGFEEKQYYSIKLTKVDAETGARLDGAEFELYDSKEDGSIGNPIQNCTSGDAGTGVAYMKDPQDRMHTAKLMLTDGTYYLKETAAPSGYNLISEPLKIVITGEDVTITGEEGNYEHSITKEAGEICITAKDGKETAPFHMQITKVDAQDDTKPLYGAEFYLYDSDLNDEMDVNAKKADCIVTADNKGTVWVEKQDGEGLLDLKDGTYYLKEAKAPEGYLIIEEPLKIVIKGETVSYAGVISNEGDSGYEAYTDGHTIRITAKDGRIPQYEVWIEKYGFTGANRDYPVADAEFSIMTGGNEVIGKGTTDETGGNTFIYPAVSTVTTAFDAANAPTDDAFMLEQNGCYILSETRSPEGFYPISDVEIKIDAYGSVTVAGKQLTAESSVSTDDEEVSYDGPGAWEISLIDNTVLHVKVYDEEIPFCTLTGTKYGTQIVTGNELSGARFELYRREPNQNQGNDLTAQGKVTSGDHGEFRFTDAQGNDLKLAYGSTYILKELTAPDGYQLMGDITLEISADGSVNVMQIGSPDADGRSLHQCTVTEKETGTGQTGKDIHISILNDAVYELPQTGGVDFYRICMILGTACMCAALGGMALLKRVKCF